MKRSISFGIRVGDEMLRLIHRYPLMALFPREAFHLVGHPVAIQTACYHVELSIRKMILTN